jgi:hypothetical protein
MHQQCTRRGFTSLQRQVQGTRQLVTSSGSQPVCPHNRVDCKPVNRSMAEQTGGIEPLSGAITVQGAYKEPSPTPAALTGLRKRVKPWTIDEQYAQMDAYAKTTFDSDFIHSTRYSLPPFEFALVENWCSSSSVPSFKVVRVYARGTFYSYFALDSQPYQASIRRSFRHAFCLKPCRY